MMPEMPRGAFPIRRSELAAAEVYGRQDNAVSFVPSGAFPSPNHELIAAQPYKPNSDAPDSYLAFPTAIEFWGDDSVENSFWAEEAFAKACAEPKVFIPPEVVMLASRHCGSANFAEFLQTHGFQFGAKAYLDGPFKCLDWTRPEVLNAAIATSAPVKIGVASRDLAHGQTQVTPGASGWVIYGLPAGEVGTYCASLCGYGSSTALAELLTREGIRVKLPGGMPTGLCYAMFARGSVGIVDSKSLMNIASEAWIRDPTTIVKDLSSSLQRS